MRPRLDGGKIAAFPIYKRRGIQVKTWMQRRAGSESEKAGTGSVSYVIARRVWSQQCIMLLTMNLKGGNQRRVK